MKKKLLYEAPSSKLFEVSLEGVIALSMSDDGTELIGKDPEEDL